MPTPTDFTVWTYDNERDGNIAVGSIFSPWFSTDGVSQLLLLGAFAGGSTAVFLESSRDGISVDHTSTDQAASISTGATVNVTWRFARVRITQSTATTTNAELAVKASD